MKPTHRFIAISRCWNWVRCFAASTKRHTGAPRVLTYNAVIYSLIALEVERIPTIKHLVKCLKHDPFFRYDCGFLLSDDVPSEAPCSSMVTTIRKIDALANVQDVLVAQAIQEGYITEESLVIDFTDFEALDKPKASEKKEKPAQ